MKPLKIIIVLLLLTSFNFYAQGDNMKEKREQIKTMKIAFLTTELDLSSTEAEKFWPIYNTFEEKEFELKHLKLLYHLFSQRNQFYSPKSWHYHHY